MKSSIKILTFMLLVLSPFSIASPQEQRFMTEGEARSVLFPKAVKFEVDTRVIGAAEKEAIFEKLKRRITEDIVIVKKAFNDANDLLGYAVLTEEKGKFLPITFMVAVNSKMKIKGVEVLVYRESRGGEVKRKRFLNQYLGKGQKNPIRINRDIANITGATISVRSINAGVRKILAMLNYFYN